MINWVLVIGKNIWLELQTYLTIFTSCIRVCIGSYKNNDIIDMCRHLQNISIGINNIVNMRPRHSIVNMHINLKHHLVHLRSLIMTCLSWSLITWSAFTQRLLVHKNYLLWLNMIEYQEEFREAHIGSGPQIFCR